MSHNKIRSETNCLNCDTQVDGRYCKNCGQENIEPKQTLWHLIMHFFQDITHFDGKFFTTLKPLLLRPGFLTAEYVKGRRMKYLDPVRLYLFVSFAFFLMYLSLNKASENVKYDNDPAAKSYIDSFNKATLYKDDFYLNSKIINGKQVFAFKFSNIYQHDYKYYDSVQKTLPDSLKSDAIERYFEKKLIPVAHVYEQNPYNFYAKITDKFYHSFSKIFFISLPIFSFLLFFLYIRRRKEYFYVSHAIFSLHCYTVAWFVLTFKEVVPLLMPDKQTVATSIISLIIFLGLFVYTYIAMLNFYKQGWFKTLAKFLILTLIMVIVVLILVMGMLANSFFEMGAH